MRFFRFFFLPVDRTAAGVENQDYKIQWRRGIEIVQTRKREK